jgi:hypothetical protein
MQANCDLSTDDVVACAELAEHMLGQEILSASQSVRQSLSLTTK